MPAAAKRRKVVATDRNASSSSSKPRGLHGFTTTSKASSTDKVIVKKNHVLEEVTTSQLERKATVGSKRKAVDIDEENISEIIKSTTTQRPIKSLPQRQSKAIPSTPHKPIVPAGSESSTKAARTLLDKFFVSSKTPSPKPETGDAELPAELLDLINLHAAFLNALSLHYAHNGTHSPADLRLLCPDVARVWGKRQVTLDDIRRTLGVQNTHLQSSASNSDKLSQLTLSDYGMGKICIEISTTGGKAGRIARPVNEDALNSIFTTGLRKLWTEREQSDTDEMSVQVKNFIASLPMECITTCPSFTKMSPLLAKGQRRLEDLKAGITIKQQTQKTKKAEKAVVSVAGAAKPTLLDRLRAKSQHEATLPPPLTAAQLARKAALQRIPEVASVITMLSTSSSAGQSRVSFTLPTVLGKLRDSFRTPMSREEGEACLRLLAAEVAPGWVKVVKMGKVEALVVEREGRLTEMGIKEGVKRAEAIL